MDSSILIENDILRESLINYYKWIVSLAIFVLTISVALFEVLYQDFEPSLLIVTGWVLLSICIFFNWLLIKRLVTIPIVYKAFEQDEASFIHNLFVNSMSNMKTYSSIQNGAFLVGILFVFLGLILY